MVQELSALSDGRMRLMESKPRGVDDTSWTDMLNFWGLSDGLAKRLYGPVLLFSRTGKLRGWFVRYLSAILENWKSLCLTNFFRLSNAIIEIEVTCKVETRFIIVYE